MSLSNNGLPLRQCLLDAYSVTLCPSCGKPLITTTSSGQEQLLCNLKNEGGLQERLDIMPILTEESYLKAYPEERKCRAYLEFCREGDVEAIVDLLRNAEEEEYENEEEAKQGRVVDVLRYRDQLGSMESGLHIAVQSQKLEVAWLLLFLGSSLEIDQFPEDVLQAAQTFGLQREDQSIKTDIRLLRDAEGNTAAQRAAIIGGFWDSWMITSILRPPEI